MSNANGSNLRRHALSVAFFAAAHLVLYVAATLLHQGFGLDAMLDRSWLSRMTGAVVRVLHFPYGPIASQVSEGWSLHVSPAGAIALLLTSSVVWGMAVHCVTLPLRRRDRQLA